MILRALLLIVVLSCLSFASHAGEQSLPLKDGAYLRNHALCEKYFKNDLDFIDFEVEQNGRSFNFINVGCVVYSVKQSRKTRYSVESDCTETGEQHKHAMILDVKPDQSIRIDGGELHHFCKRQEKSKKPDTFTVNADGKPLGTDQTRHIGKAVPTLIAEWETAYEGCRGGAGDDPKTDKACNEFGELEVLLNQSGQCYADSGWKPCEGEAPTD